MTLVLEIKHSNCVVSCIILPRALGKMVQYTGQNDTVNFFSSQIQIFKVSKGAKIRNRYNQVPHLTQDTNGKETNSQ